ncbi:MAG: restriction endonuclease subunit S [Lactobacillaceae bacterium]|nr:restriction endonuclease subunit S [Bombilactobacillus mellis]
MNSDKVVPNIRFRKFEKNWETEKLEKLGNTFPSLSGKSKKDFGHGNAKYITYMNVFTNPIALMSGTEAIEIDKKQNSVKYGDVFFTMSSETPEEVGMSSVWEYHLENVYLNSFSFGFRPNSKFDLNFLAFLLRSQGVRSQIVILAQGISRFNISKVKMMSINITFPINYFEQQKIGDFFTKLDKLLYLQQQKIEKLELLKKALLQKLFPKHDTKIPELRFKGFEDDWQEKKLSYVVDIIMGQSPSSTNYYDTPIENSMILIQGNTDIKNHSVKPRIWTTQITRIAMPKDVLLTVRAPVGEVAKNKYEAVIGRGMAALRGNDFLYYNLEKLKMVGYWEHLSTGSTFESISSNDIRDTKIKIPSCKEQEKVYKLLSKVDQLIELENKKLQNFQQVKKCLLQNMFVE